MENNILIFDSTLRDGSHAIDQKLELTTIADYCREIDDCGMHTVMVGHGNGLGGSSIHGGLLKFDEIEMLRTAKANLKKTKLGVFIVPGLGTVQRNLIPAIEAGAEVFNVATNCTEATGTISHVNFLTQKFSEVYVVFMMCHLANAPTLLEQAKIIEEYGAKGLILMDSAGASTPEMVKENISTLVNGTSLKIGFHAHNNLGLAVANSYTAIQEGATIIDGTMRGFGAGSGNCQLEAFASLMKKTGKPLPINLKKMFNISEKIIRPIMPRDCGIPAVNIASGMTEIFSAFIIPVRLAAEKYGVDPIDIFEELGRRRAAPGQEDLTLEIAQSLSKEKK
ncbi:MAG: 4-hydroxy-2-oxovalerate aldolase [Clostridia bacterium]|nr:4-hydroxy-2-oxovalerate aldolase [Clostridia bacterium]